MNWIKNSTQFLFIHNIFFQNQASYRFIGINCFFRNVCCFFITYMRTNRCNDSYTVFYQLTTSFFIGRNSYDTIIYECLNCIAKRIDRLEHTIENDRLKCI